MTDSLESSRFSFEKAQKDNTVGVDLPKSLKERAQWLVTNEKKPRFPSEGWNNTENLLPFETAKQKACEVGGEVAFCFDDSDPFVGFDLDNVADEDSFTDEALNVVDSIGSYTEVSSSGEGLHVVVRDEKLTASTRGTMDGNSHIEVYDRNRYFVLTGDVLDHRHEVTDGDSSDVQMQYLTSTKHSTENANSISEYSYADKTVNATPDQVYGTIKAYAESDNDSVDGELLRLWEGSDEGRTSTSEADLAFAAQLYFWCRGDPDLMDECFRRSGRSREKWDTVRTSDGRTYGEMTISKAIETNHNVFDGRYVN